MSSKFENTKDMGYSHSVANEAELEFRLEMERMQMSREEKMSIIFNNMQYHQYFDQKDELPPKLPSSVT